MFLAPLSVSAHGRHARRALDARPIFDPCFHGNMSFLEFKERDAQSMCFHDLCQAVHVSDQKIADFGDFIPIHRKPLGLPMRLVHG